MCLILFGYKVSEKYPLILAANRDEFHQRPTKSMHFWQESPYILAGKDLEQGGTWMGINKDTGRFAALTNYRDPAALNATAPSRGGIIVDFLTTNADINTHSIDFQKTAHAYNGFNLLFGTKEELYWFCNVKNSMEKVPPGVHGLSNRFLDTPWPKVESGKKALQKVIDKNINRDALFSILTDQYTPDDTALPDTGIGLEWERLLSPLFIQSPTYGTRSSTVLLMDQKGNIEVTERSYTPENKLDFSDEHFTISI
jgi:uncharacterized protein with NRDE domain